MDLPVYSGLTVSKIYVITSEYSWMQRPFSSLTPEKDCDSREEKRPRFVSPTNNSGSSMTDQEGPAMDPNIATILNGIYEKLTRLDSIEQKVSNIDSIQQKISNIDKSLMDLNKTVDDTKKVAEEANQKCKDLQKQVCQLEYKNLRLQSQMDTIHESNLRIESQSRRINLNLDGVPEESNEKPETTQRILRNILSKLDEPDGSYFKNVKIERCHRRAGKKNQPRPIIVKFHSYTDREAVWKKRDKIKKAGFFLREDFPEVYEQRRARLRSIVKTAKNDPRYKNMDISISVDRLYLDGKFYRHDQLESLPDGLRPSQLSTRKIGDKTLFFHKDSPFSNFHPSIFVIDGQEYNSCEQFYQYKKATYFNDDIAAKKIISTDNPHEQYKCGQEVKSYDAAKWYPREAIKTMEEAVQAKFSQNEPLCHMLVATQGTSLVECSPHDLFWGSGLGLYHPQAADSSYYTGQNKLGNILDSVRQHLISMST